MPEGRHDRPAWPPAPFRPPHIKTKTFKDLTAGDLIEVTDKDLNLLASIPKLEAGDNEIIVQ